MSYNVPVWQATNPGYPGWAGHANQFLSAHQTTLVYTGAAVTTSQTSGSGTFINTDGQYLSQQFVTGTTQTAISQVQIQVSTVGGSAVTNNMDPLTVSIYADFGGFPTGSALVSTTLTETLVYSSPFWVTFLTPITGLSPSTTYHIVTNPAGVSGSHYYVWQKSNQLGGAVTSPDGANWTLQSYGLMFKVLDQTPSGLLQYVIQDNGARWTQYAYNSLNQITTINEYTIDQTGTGNFYSTRTLSYTNGMLTGVA